MLIFRDLMVALGFAGLEVILVILIGWRVQAIMKRRMSLPELDIFKNPVTTVHLPDRIADNA